MMTLREALTKCYDQTTPDSRGGNRVEAQLNQQLYNAAFAPIHTGMKNLREKNAVCASLLMYLHTDVFTMDDVVSIYSAIEFDFYARLDTKINNQTTIKLGEFFAHALAHEKSRFTSKPRTKEQLADTLGIDQSNWYKCKQGACWDKWFRWVDEFLGRMESTGEVEMSQYLKQVHDKFRADTI